MTQNKHKKPVTFAFIDATNIIYGASHHGWRVDFAKLADYLRTRFEVTKILYYAGVDNENIKQLKFYEKLQEFGYELRLVPVKTFKDGSKKADVDSRMTFEMMRYLKTYNRAVIMTGDGDYCWVIEYLLKIKEKVWVLSNPKSTAQELKQLIKGDFANLNNIRSRIELRGKKMSQTLRTTLAPGIMSKQYHKTKSLSRGKK